MTSFWILLLFIICLPKTGSTGENPTDHGHYTHDAVMISRLHDAHHLWRQGYQTFSGIIKARERPGKRGRRILEEEKTQKNRGETKKTQATHRAKTQTQIRKEKPAPSSVLHHKD
jgi:hypothetical protein